MGRIGVKGHGRPLDTWQLFHSQKFVVEPTKGWDSRFAKSTSGSCEMGY